jgi:hypothetical protein
MLSDPQSITVNAVAQSMPKLSTSGTSAVYQKSDSTYKLEVSHQKAAKNRIRSLARFTRRAVVADPLTAVNDYETLSVQVVIDRPEVGFSSTEVDQLVTGFKAWLDSTMIGKLYAQES